MSTLQLLDIATATTASKLEPSGGESSNGGGQEDHGGGELQLRAGTVEGSLGDHDVGLLHQRVIDHVDDAVGALHIWPEHVDPSVAPEDLVS